MNKQWKITYFNRKVFDAILDLPSKLRARFFVLQERMQIEGPNFGIPHTKAIGDGLFEVRVKASEGIARVFYCTSKGQEIVVLHSFVKKTQATPKKELNLAHKRQREVKQND